MFPEIFARTHPIGNFQHNYEKHPFPSLELWKLRFFQKTDWLELILITFRQTWQLVVWNHLSGNVRIWSIQVVMLFFGQVDQFGFIRIQVSSWTSLKFGIYLTLIAHHLDTSLFLELTTYTIQHTYDNDVIYSLEFQNIVLYQNII